MVADLVDLADLDVISQYSLAVRTASVERAELLQVLEADLAWLRSTQPPPPSPPAPRPDRRRTARRATDRRA